MLEKALGRLARQCYYDRKQYPEIFFEIEEYINLIRSWLRDNEIFASSEALYVSFGLVFESLGMMITQLWKTCKPKTGKKGIKKSRRDREMEAIYQTITSMKGNISQHIESAKDNFHTIGIALEKGVLRSFDQTIIQNLKNLEDLLSKRGGQTYIFPWRDKETYPDFVKDKKRFHIEVLDKLDEYTHHTGHELGCSGPKEYHLSGYRTNPRNTIMNDGEQETYPIRMIQCKNCKNRFSLVPSFLPREKNFAIEIIGNVCRNMFRFNLSIQGAIENLKFIGKKSVKSKQTILNWMQWVGSVHPATILTRAGLNGSAYLQEDEGFEKEPNLRTYCVVMVDPQNQLVWHTDYVDHVDEKELSGSFENFLHKIDFKILGVTKDKWKASTHALRSVFHRIWIGYCHRHCLKNFRDALSKYKDQSGCTDKEVSRLYKKFKKVLKTSTSKINLEARIKSLNDEAFSAPILIERLEELKENAVHYTAHKNRTGITQTTSIVDNYLKGIKRKLRQIESFRDNEWAKLFFRAHANVRNFVPFLPGSKNAHKSPFQLAGGQTYGLPWIQTMSVHNAFLFTENAL